MKQILEAPLVSVLMTTYAHENTIVKAIEGVLFQQTNFKLDLIIANDCSPDGTHLLVETFLKQAIIPANINIIYTNHLTNKGMMNNIIWTIRKVRGKYIAICEGDDYWIDPLKLQKQVDFLEANEDYGLVHTNYKKYFAKTGNFVDHMPVKKFSREDENEYFLHSGDIRTCTVMFRSSFLPKFKDLMKQDFMKKTVVGDRPFFLLISKLSKIHFINEITSVYYITAFISASNFSNLFRYYDFLKKVSLVNIELMSYLQIENPSYIKDQKRKISFYEVVLGLDEKKDIHFIKKLFSRSGKYFWNLSELRELYGLFKNK